MKYLITGGCGFMGSNLSAEVLRRGDELIVFDSLCRYGSALNLDWLRSLGSFSFIKADICDRSAVESVVRENRPDNIFHLAGQVAMTTSIENPRLDFDINVGGSINILEAVRLYSPDSTVLYSSSNKVYGDLNQFTYTETPTRYICQEHPQGFDESIPLEFHSPYGCSKGSADQYMQDFSRIYGLKTVVFRHSSMYGGRQFSTYDQGWIGWFAQKAVEVKRGLLKESFTISGNGKQVRDVLHAQDVVRLYFKAADKIDCIKGQVFNIGGGIANSLSLLELFSICEQSIGSKMPFICLPVRISDQKSFVAQTKAVHAALDWTPAIGSRDGVLDMLSWVENL
jgi:CDP-paratose 2-epimerase